MTRHGYRRFNKEVEILLSLYNGALVAFREQQEIVQDKINNDRKFKYGEVATYLDEKEEEKYLIASNAFILLNKYKNSFGKEMRKLLLIRFISALEVFFVDTVKELFLGNKELFEGEQFLEIKYREILAAKSITEIWTVIINKEARKIQNQGFIDCMKFYKKKFGIDFKNSGVNFEKIEKYHVMRHLLVHRLGQTDKKYRTKFRDNRKLITISHDEIYEIIENLRSLVEYVNDSAVLVVNNVRRKDDIFQVACKYSFKLIKAVDFLKPNHTFYVGDDIVKVKDIIISNEQKNNDSIELIFKATPDIVKSFRKKLRGANKKGDIVILSKSELNKSKRLQEISNRYKGRVISEDDISKFISEIREKFGLSNSEAKKVIGLMKKN